MTESNVGIEIRNLPSHMTREELFDVFAKGLDSNNEVKYILYPLAGNAGQAFVCFKQIPDTRFVEGLLAQNPLWSIKSVTRVQTYSTCSAEVNSLVVASIPDVWDCIRMLRTTYGIMADYSEETGKLVLKGSLNQLSCGHERLNSIFEEQMMLQKMGLMHFGQSDQSQVMESYRPEDDDVVQGPSFAELKSVKSRALGENVVEEEEFRGHAVMPRSEGKKWNSHSDILTFQSARSSDCERDLAVLKSTNENNNSLPYFVHKSELSRFESAGTDKSGPQSLPCLTGIDEKNVFTSKPRNTSEELWGLEHKRNYLHSDITSRRQRGKNDEREEADGENDDVLEGPQDLKSSHYMSSESSAYRGTSENVTSRLSSGDRRNDRRLNKSSMHAADDSVIDAHSRVKIVLDGETNDDAISTSIEDRKEFNSGSVSDLPYTTAHYNTNSFFSTGSSHMRMSTLSEFELERKSFVFPSEIAIENNLEKNIEEDSLKQESLFLESFVVRYIIAVEERQVNTIARSCNVRIKVNIEAGSAITEVTFVGNNLCQDEHLSTAVTQFTELYEETFGDIIQRDVKCDFSRPEVIAAMNRIRFLHGDRVILITDQTGLIVVVGEFKEVVRAVDMLNLAESGTENRGHSFATFGGKSSSGKEALLSDPEIETPDEDETDELHEKEGSVMEPSGRSGAISSAHSDVTTRDYAAVAKAKQTQSDFAAVPNKNYFHVIFKENFHVFIYTEDITKVKTHAIVNAANSYLKNYGGVAGAIEKAGGRKFVKDCDALYRSHGPLKVSEVLHSVGRGALECAFVMHTVGPFWYSDRDDDTCFADLQATFTNVLDYADTVLKSVSIAVPPVGTGVFGVPLDVCARAIYFAVKEFVEKQCHRPDSSLRFLHIVSNDPGSTEFIQAVFEGLKLAQEDQRTHAEDAYSSVDMVVSSAGNDDDRAAGSLSEQNLRLDSHI